MKEPTRTALVVTARTVAVAACVALVVTRTAVGWGSLLVMLGALGGLLVMLAAYNRRFQ
jgi:hypothetical protein